MKVEFVRFGKVLATDHHNPAHLHVPRKGEIVLLSGQRLQVTEVCHEYGPVGGYTMEEGSELRKVIVTLACAPNPE